MLDEVDLFISGTGHSFMTMGGRSQMTFYREYFRSLFDACVEKFAAHSILCDKGPVIIYGQGGGEEKVGRGEGLRTFFD